MLTPYHIMASVNKKYLVLVSQFDGTYKAYDDLVVEIEGKLMVKAKPLSSALSATYSDRTGSEKGCIIESGNVTNTYTLNSKTVLLKNGEDLTKYKAPVKQCFVNSDNLIYYDTVKSLTNVSYYKASEASPYKKLGYTGGVIVYNSDEQCPRLPNTTDIIAWNNQMCEANLHTNKYIISPTVKDDLVFNKYPTKYIKVDYYDKTKMIKTLFDFKPIHEFYKNNQLPGEGIYGLGHCNDTLIIRGLDDQGNVLKEFTTTDDVFLIDFPGASTLCIINTTANDSFAQIFFTPVKPTVITENSKISFRDINWIDQNGLSTQFFVVPEYFEESFENLRAYQSIMTRYVESDIKKLHSSNNSYALKIITVANKDDNLNAYLKYTQRATLPLISNSNVIVYDSSKDLWASNYEDQLINMLNTIKQCGTNYYFPTATFDQQLIIRCESDITSAAGSDQIILTPKNFNLDCANDYRTHLHEMTHFFQAQNEDYSWMIPAWTEGIADALSLQALSNMKIPLDSSINQFGKIDLTPEQAADFESYFLSITNTIVGDSTAYNVGNQFITYLQKTYGDDIICKIFKAEMDANIPKMINGTCCRDKERDKQFTNCIKSKTSKNVFQDFVTYYKSL